MAEDSKRAIEVAQKLDRLAADIVDAALGRLIIFPPFAKAILLRAVIQKLARKLIEIESDG